MVCWLTTTPGSTFPSLSFSGWAWTLPSSRFLDRCLMRHQKIKTARKPGKSHSLSLTHCPGWIPLLGCNLYLLDSTLPGSSLYRCGVTFKIESTVEPQPEDAHEEDFLQSRAWAPVPQTKEEEARERLAPPLTSKRHGFLFLHFHEPLLPLFVLSFPVWLMRVRIHLSC